MTTQAEMFDGAVAAIEHCCTECGCDLEEDQTGLCEDCEGARPRAFSELSDRAKDRAREVYTGPGYLDYDWWDYDDFVTVGKLLGIEIGKTRQEPDIQFSGFCSQGDGACFSGRYECAPNAIKDIAAYAGQDSVLRGIAERLTSVQVLARLKWGETLSARISTAQSGYSHSGTMITELCELESFDDEGRPDTTDVEETIHECMTDFADWIYAQLEAEYDWLMSDECVDERLAEEKFDEAGNVL